MRSTRNPSPASQPLTVAPVRSPPSSRRDNMSGVLASVGCCSRHGEHRATMARPSRRKTSRPAGVFMLRPSSSCATPGAVASRTSPDTFRCSAWPATRTSVVHAGAAVESTPLESTKTLSAPARQIKASPMVEPTQSSVRGSGFIWIRRRARSPLSPTTVRRRTARPRTRPRCRSRRYLRCPGCVRRRAGARHRARRQSSSTARPPRQ